MEPEEKEILSIDIAGVVDYYLNTLSEETYSVLCRLARMRISLLVPLLQVMNNPDVKESVAHLPIWKQVQHGFRQFSTVETLHSKSYYKLMPTSFFPDSLPPKLAAMHRKQRTVSRWDSWYWDKGVGNELWFIGCGWINYFFFNGRNLRDPILLNTNAYELVVETEEGEKVDTFDSSYKFRRDIWLHKKRYAEQELQTMSRFKRLVYYMEVSRDCHRRDGQGTTVVTTGRMSIKPSFVPHKYEHLADKNGYLDASLLYFDHHRS